jgi:hypothetical protein
VKEDEMLRVYESPEGVIAIRVGHRGYLLINPEPRRIKYVAVPADDDGFMASVPVEKWNLKHLRTYNIDLEAEIEAVAIREDVSKRVARQRVRQAREAVKATVRAIEEMAQRFILEVGDRGNEPDKDDVLGAEFIGE